MEVLIDSIWPDGWKRILAEYETACNKLQPSQRGSFTDEFFLACLKRVGANAVDQSLWLLAGKWHAYRKLPLTGYDVQPAEEELLWQFQTLLREALDRQLSEPSFSLPTFGPQGTKAILGMWSEIFLSCHSALNQRVIAEGSPGLAEKPVVSEDSPGYYYWLLSRSMYYPFDADRFSVDPERLVTAAIPSFIKVLLVIWLMNIPAYNASQQHWQKSKRAAVGIEQATRRHPTWMDPYFHHLAEWLMTDVFRMAYVHEDNSQTLSLFGDFISSQINRLLPAFADFRRETGLHFTPGRRIRIGYVSSRFVTNAVTLYMANRILHHDRDTFEVHVFSLGPRQDEMTELLAKNCDRFVRLDNALDYNATARCIRESELDILVYADIGMEISTYLLAGLRLAPLQAALLGHAASTGLPTIDCYFSSEVEPPHAQSHYREQLIRMPNVGASQLLPPGLKNGVPQAFSRANMGIPTDAFVFVSCANGMKHIPERDYIWTEILRRIPHAWILIKPFSPGDYDHRLVARLKAVGEAAGAPERIRFVNSMGGHQDMFSLLGMADAQLDTFPFNGWTTTVEALSLNLPTVTQEGNGYRSRLGAGFLRALGIEEGIAATEAEYIEWAVRLANYPTLCAWLRKRIRATGKLLLFDNKALQLEYEKALLRMVRQQAQISQ